MLLKDILTKEQKDNSGIVVPIGVNDRGEVVKIRLDVNGLTVIGMTGAGKSVLQSVIVYASAYYYAKDNVTFQIIDMHEGREEEYRQYFGDKATQKKLNITKLACGISIGELLKYLDGVMADMDRKYAILSSSPYKHIDDYNANVDEAERLAYVNVCLTDINFVRDWTAQERDEVGKKIARIRNLGRACGHNVILFEQNFPKYRGIYFQPLSCAYVIGYKSAARIQELEFIGLKDLFNLKCFAGEGYLYNYMNNSISKIYTFDMGQDKDREDLLKLIKKA